MRVEKSKILLRVKGFLCQGDVISSDFAAFFVVNAIYGFVARIGDLYRVFRQFDLRDKLSVFSADGGQFVYTAKSRSVFGSDEIGSHTPGINAGTLREEGVD